MRAILILLFLQFQLATAIAADWKEKPLVYGVSPFYISQGLKVKGLENIRRRLPEIKSLGANIVWLQPISTPSAPGHGYDVVDFKAVWSELGTEADLRRLVQDAHKLDMRLMLDVVLNHSSDKHPFVKDIAEQGSKSKYSGYYQEEPMPKVPYSNFMKTRTIGESQFVHYFWDHLLNFNFNNLQLRDYIHGVLQYWIEEFDVDGFRFDASWAPSSRYPNFYKEISTRARKFKPDLILMAEDKVGYPAAYKGTDHPHLKDSGFDWAYDWDNQDTEWISRWSFAVDPTEDKSVFNFEDAELAAKHFVKALEFSRDTGEVKALRYTENNDTPGLLKSHTLAEAKFAVTVTLTLPGVPLIFYGQEVGNDHELFHLPSFDPAKPIKKTNPALFCFYKQVIGLRQSSDPLAKGTLENVQIQSKTKVSFVRRYKNERAEVTLDFTKKQVVVDHKSVTAQPFRYPAQDKDVALDKCS